MTASTIVVALNAQLLRRVDESAIVDALQRRVIGCPALDVYETEPLPVDHPCGPWTMLF